MHTNKSTARRTPPRLARHLIERFGAKQTGGHGGLEILRHIGPGLLVTVGFIDPGNWASNMAAGSQFGYALLWVVTLSTIMLIVLQHNAAHLGIVTGTCLAEATREHLPRPAALLVLGSAYLATIATALAEVLGRPSRCRCSLACRCARDASSWPRRPCSCWPPAPTGASSAGS